MKTKNNRKKMIVFIVIGVLFLSGLYFSHEYKKIRDTENLTPKEWVEKYND